MNFTRQKGVIVSRIERIKREGSPAYVWNVDPIGAGAAATIGIREQFPASRKYEPLDWIEIVNNEATNNLQVNINGAAVTFLIPARTIRTIERQPIWNLTITNLGGVITVLGNIICTMQRAPLTTDRLMRGDI